MVVDDGAEQSSHISVICSSYMRDMFSVRYATRRLLPIKADCMSFTGIPCGLYSQEMRRHANAIQRILSECMC